MDVEWKPIVFVWVIVRFSVWRNSRIFRNWDQIMRLDLPAVLAIDEVLQLEFRRVEVGP